jgi:hypothetical protein
MPRPGNLHGQRKHFHQAVTASDVEPKTVCLCRCECMTHMYAHILCGLSHGHNNATCIMLAQECESLQTQAQHAYKLLYHN